MTTAAKDTIVIGDHLQLRFRAKVGEGEQLLFQPPPNPLVQGVELLSPIEVDTLSVDGLGVELEGKVKITSFDSGEYKLPAFVAYKIKRDGGVDTLSFDGGELVVQTIQIDTTIFKPYDIKGQMGYPVTALEVLSWIGGIVLILSLIMVIVKMVKKLIKGRGKRESKLSTKPAHVVALERLEEIKESQVWLQDQKLYYSQLTEVLRSYIEFAYSFGALEMTSKEIIDAISPMIEKDKSRSLSTLFIVADLVKFAKYRGESVECEKHLEWSIKFIEQSHKAATEEEKEE